MASVLEIKQLQKSFGTHEVLRGLDMAVPEHSIYGFVGQNGAGKTTTMKIVLGLLRSDGGEVYVCGERASYGETKTNRHIGYLPDVPEFYNYMRPLEYLQLCGQITGLSKQQTGSHGAELLEMVGLAGERKRIGSFSRGMKQRLGIAQALLNDPRLLICDEPTSALDPIGRKEILDILLEVKGKTTVVFSTHVLSDVERICDYVAILHEGRLALSGTLAELKSRRYDSGFLIEFADTDSLERFAARHAKLRQTPLAPTQAGLTLTIISEDKSLTGQMLIDMLSELRIVPVRFELLEPTLESLFSEVVS